jgi:hypothetical protein
MCVRPVCRFTLTFAGPQVCLVGFSGWAESARLLIKTMLDSAWREWTGDRRLHAQIRRLLMDKFKPTLKS